MLGQPPNCESCGAVMEEKKDANAPDGLKRRCKARIMLENRKSKRCDHSRSYRKHTCFARTKLPIWKILEFIDLWLKKAIGPLTVGKSFSTLAGLMHNLWAALVKSYR
uniref:Transposase n=1 Tax=Bursaphelenchus xylophilus TaxID=6326 RepID=A0A1I7SK91_BURXY